MLKWLLAIVILAVVSGLGSSLSPRRWRFGHLPGDLHFDLFGRQEGRVSEIREESAGRLVFIEDETRAEVPERLEPDQRVGIAGMLVEHDFGDDALLTKRVPKHEAFDHLVQRHDLSGRVVNDAFR